MIVFVVAEGKKYFRRGRKYICTFTDKEKAKQFRDAKGSGTVEEIARDELDGIANERGLEVDLDPDDSLAPETKFLFF